MQIAKEDLGGTVDKTSYVLTTDNMPQPEDIGLTDWPYF